MVEQVDGPNNFSGAEILPQAVRLFWGLSADKNKKYKETDGSSSLSMKLGSRLGRDQGPTTVSFMGAMVANHTSPCLRTLFLWR